MKKSQQKIDILFKDEYLLAVSKPSGLLTIPERYDPANRYLTEALTPKYGPLWVVHRLDKETSGVVVLARTAEAHKNLSMQFSSHSVVKVYHALISGRPAWDAKSVDIPLRTNGDRRHRTVIDRNNGKPSLTVLHILERLGPFTLIEAKPETGRTHQIRAHLKAMGLPVVVDRLYGREEPIYLSRLKRNYRRTRDEERPLLGRLGLHAFSITFTHPITEEPMSILAPYPKDFRATLYQLRRLYEED